MRHIRIAIVGDIHDQWDGGDHLALSHLKPDLVLFVGDIGNEAVALVELINTLDIPKAVILGNHDAWYTASEWGRKRSPYKGEGQGCRVQRQLEILADCHVGYGYKDFPALGLSVVGGRPFSWGGAEWKNGSFYAERFGVTDFQSSLDLICAQAGQAQFHNLIFLGHNGPIGLGAQPSAPCGKDWKPLGGDYGDPDFYSAIEFCRQTHAIPLVAFGHMHHHLKVEPYQRETIVVQRGTVYINAACVPRWRLVGDTIFRFFTVVELVDYQVESVRQLWVEQNGTIGTEVVTKIATAPGNLCQFSLLQ
ncbi:MAG: TIGR04168 family protein [Pseudanabaenaceae cyanobacterium]